MNTYLSLFLENINKQGSETAIVYGGVKYDAQKIINAVEMYKAFLKEKGFSRRSRVAFLGNRNLESIAFFHALLALDLIPVLIDKTLPEDQISILLNEEDWAFKCTSVGGTKFLENISSIQQIPDILPNEQTVICANETKKLPDDIIFVAHTSGTTGLPKKVAYTEENIWWVINEYKVIYNLDENGTVLFALPFHYCFGFIACCLSPLSLGKSVVLLHDNADAEEIAQLIEKEGINILVANPYVYNELCKIDLSQLDFSKLKICDSGGEPLPPPIIEKFKNQTEVVITEGYGLTETTSLTHFLLPDRFGKIRIGSVGRPCHNVSAAIVDQDFQVLPHGEVGELLVKGPMVIRSYDNPEFNERAFHDGWFRTGDIFYKDDEDYYYLVGRKKDIGEVSLALSKEVSSVISKLFSLNIVSDLAYRLVSNAELQVYIVPRIAISSFVDTKNVIIEARDLLPETIREICFFRFVSSLPRTATGKVIKREL